MRVAFAVPRFGAQIVGGAERGARELAERLARRPGWSVEVFTTCAQDARTWADAYEPGTTTEAGVTVHRWRSRAGRDRHFERCSDVLLRAPRRASKADAERWIDMQGPVCPEVVEAAAASGAEVVAFYPYLYYPSVKGVPMLGNRAVLHAAAHDEPPLRLPVFPPVFGSAGGLVFHTQAERDLVQRMFGGAERPQIVLGLGVQRGAGDSGAAVERFGLAGRPYLCCLGRVDEGKGSGVLARYFHAYKQRHPGPLALAFVGPVISRVPEHRDIVVTGVLDDSEYWGMIEGSTAFVSPSAMESFSIVMVEAWSSGIPALVNGACHATVEHCRRSGGGLWFRGFAGFEAALDRLVGDEALRAELADRGRRYVEANFAWPVVIERYARFLESVAARAPAALSGRGRSSSPPGRRQQPQLA